jgi:hypothetical protein
MNQAEANPTSSSVAGGGGAAPGYVYANSAATDYTGSNGNRDGNSSRHSHTAIVSGSSTSNGNGKHQRDWIVGDPRERDVLLGRGGRSNSHMGNKSFRALVVFYKPKYRLAQSNKEKQAIVKSIVAGICDELDVDEIDASTVPASHSLPGRFIKFDTSHKKWYNVGLHTARNKTSQALREDNQCNSASAKPFVDSLGMWNNHKQTPQTSQSQSPALASALASAVAPAKSSGINIKQSNGAPNDIDADANINTNMPCCRDETPPSAANVNAHASMAMLVESPHLNRIVQNMMGMPTAAAPPTPPPLPPRWQNERMGSGGGSSSTGDSSIGAGTAPDLLRKESRAVTRGTSARDIMAQPQLPQPPQDDVMQVKQDDAFLYGNGNGNGTGVNVNNVNNGYHGSSRSLRDVTQEYGGGGGVVQSLPRIPPPPSAASIIALENLKQEQQAEGMGRSRSMSNHNANGVSSVQDHVHAAHAHGGLLVQAHAQAHSGPLPLITPSHSTFNSASTSPKRTAANMTVNMARNHQSQTPLNNHNNHNHNSFKVGLVPSANANSSSNQAPFEYAKDMDMNSDMIGSINVNAKQPQHPQPHHVMHTYAPAILKINPRSKLRRSYSDTFVTDFNHLKRESFTKSWKELKVMSAAPNFASPPKPTSTKVVVKVEVGPSSTARPRTSSSSHSRPPSAAASAASAVPSFAAVGSASSSAFAVRSHASSFDHDHQQQQMRRSFQAQYQTRQETMNHNNLTTAQHRLASVIQSGAALLQSGAASATFPVGQQAHANALITMTTEQQLEAIQRLFYGAESEYANHSRGGGEMANRGGGGQVMDMAHQHQHDTNSSLPPYNIPHHRRQLSNIKPDTIARHVTEHALVEGRFQHQHSAIAADIDSNANGSINGNANIKLEESSSVTSGGPRSLLKKRSKFDKKRNFEDAILETEPQPPVSVSGPMPVLREQDSTLAQAQASAALSLAQQPLSQQQSAAVAVAQNASPVPAPAPKQRKKRQKQQGSGQGQGGSTSTATSPRKKRLLTANMVSQNNVVNNVNMNMASTNKLTPEEIFNVNVSVSGVKLEEDNGNNNGAAAAVSREKLLSSNNVNVVNKYKPFDDHAPLATLITEPRDQDVLFGRGGRTNHHLGNKRFRQLVEDHRQQYRQLQGNKLKQKIALEIVQLIYNQDHGRFLKLMSPAAIAASGGDINSTPGLWQDVGKKIARGKTSQALREAATTLTKQQNRDRKSDGNGLTKTAALPTPDTDTDTVTVGQISRPQSATSFGANGNGSLLPRQAGSTTSTPPPPLPPHPAATVQTKREAEGQVEVEADSVVTNNKTKTQDDHDQDLGMLLMSLKTSNSPRAV